MYNPQQDRSAEILANAYNNAAEMQLAGMQSMGNSFANLGDTAAKAYSKASENKMTSDYLDAMAGQFNATGRPDGTPYMSNEDLEKFSKSPLGRKTGMIAAIQAQQEYDMKKWMYETQYNNYMGRVAAQANSRQPAPNQVPMGAGGPSSSPAATSVPFNVGVPIN